MRMLAALALVIGCESRTSLLERSGTYFIDGRSGLCFAYWETFSQSGPRPTITNVPCTPEVMQIINETPKD